MPGIPGLVLSTLAFFAATWYLRRVCDRNDIPLGMTRSLAIFAVALLLSYAVGDATDWVIAHL
jgi:hypothetical protein